MLGWQILAAALLGLTLLWIVFEPLIIGRTDPAPLSDADPTELEETPEGAALVALKDLEFDHATGKISRADYEQLKTKYTRLAVGSLRRAANVRPPSSPGPPSPLGAGSASACSSCGPRPEVDAIFCSDCGRRLEKHAA